VSVHRLEELSTVALDAFDRERTVVVLTVSPLEQHGPHLPLGVDAFAARHFAEAIAERLTATRDGWSALLAPTLPVGSFTFEAPGTVRVRQRVVRDLVVDYGASLARAGFRYLFVANGHAGPGHLAALEEAAAIVSRRHGVVMASFSGHLAWEFLRGRYLDRIETALGRPLAEAERTALADDAHAGWWETSLMLMLRPELVDDRYRDLPATRYSLARRLVPNYPLRSGGRGYVGHPAFADVTVAKAVSEVLIGEAMTLVDAALDGRLRPGQRRSPFFAIPLFRTNFWWAAALVGTLAAAGVGLGAARRRGRVRVIPGERG
jgi:creatinine amidohydrolase